MAQGDGMGSFVSGLIVGLVLSAPVAAWLSPRSGAETRQAIVQRGVIMRRRVAETLRKPVAQVQEQLEHIKGVSVNDALAEGRTIAMRRLTNRDS